MRRLAAEKQLSLSLRFHKAQLEQKELGKKEFLIQYIQYFNGSQAQWEFEEACV